MARKRPRFIRKGMGSNALKKKRSLDESIPVPYNGEKYLVCPKIEDGTCNSMLCIHSVPHKKFASCDFHVKEKCQRMFSINVLGSFDWDATCCEQYKFIEDGDFEV